MRSSDVDRRKEIDVATVSRNRTDHFSLAFTYAWMAAEKKFPKSAGISIA
jgi:hypothetical protein